MIKFTLPPLPYSHEALRPHIDSETMKIHHGRHHQGYVDKLNTALAAYPDASGDLETLLGQITNYNLAVRNNAGGHYNHSLFWESMAPGSGVLGPSGLLHDALVRDFGGFTRFTNTFTQHAQQLFGSGWTWLCASKTGVLSIMNTPNQDNPLMEDIAAEGKPILGLDVWEHAYYLKYKNERPRYIQAFWSIVNWVKVTERYATIIDE